MDNSASVTVNHALRLLGAGNATAKSDFFTDNKKLRALFPGNKVFVANDIWGGLYAIGNGDFSGNPESLWYYAPDTLRWETLGIDYSNFIFWAASDRLDGFYETFQCAEISALSKKMQSDEGLLIYPFLWSKECDIQKAEKKIIPFLNWCS